MDFTLLNTLGTITWTVDPVAFSIGSLSVRWYGILLATGFFLSYFTLSKIFKKEHISQTLLDKFFIWTVIWTIVGLRLAHFIFYEPEYFKTSPWIILLPFDENWHFTGFQGLASHGAVIAIITFVCYFAWKHKINLFWLIDRSAIAIPIAAGLVRLGNLMNHEIVGSITTVPWAFNFTLGDPIRDAQGYIIEQVAGTFRHPAQIYESIVYLLLFLGLVLYYFKYSKSKLPPGLTTGILLFVIFTARFIIEFFKAVQVPDELEMMLDIGQKLSIPFILIGLGLITYSIINRKKCPTYVEPVSQPAEEKK
ncbi:MAG: prolipoprotein diacylglyceryl transferase [Bacteroidales bacterium]|jgi:prolipoprotein diacylglyceryl transferase|nr:prolipoprotein diacylglyceryl transferase [Bacteroidales bacterium]